MFAQHFRVAHASGDAKMLVQVWRLVPAKTELIGPADDRGYSEFNRSAIRFMPDFDFS